MLNVVVVVFLIFQFTYINNYTTAPWLCSMHIFFKRSTTTVISRIITRHKENVMHELEDLYLSAARENLL